MLETDPDVAVDAAWFARKIGAAVGLRREVLGHELAHVSSRDVLASTASAGLATIITFPAVLPRLARSGLMGFKMTSGGLAARGLAHERGPALGRRDVAA